MLSYMELPLSWLLFSANNMYRQNLSNEGEAFTKDSHHLVIYTTNLYPSVLMEATHHLMISVRCEGKGERPRSSQIARKLELV